MRPYEDHPAAGAFLLEESYVLDIDARPASVQIEVDLVLTPKHPDYADPPADEQFCFRRGRISFTGVKACSWTGQGLRPAVDATGEQDYGNIDRLAWEPRHYLVEGSFGLLEIEADDMEFALQ